MRRSCCEPALEFGRVQGGTRGVQRSAWLAVSVRGSDVGASVGSSTARGEGTAGMRASHERQDSQEAPSQQTGADHGHFPGEGSSTFLRSLGVCDYNTNRLHREQEEGGPAEPD